MKTCLFVVLIAGYIFAGPISATIEVPAKEQAVTYGRIVVDGLKVIFTRPGNRPYVAEMDSTQYVTVMNVLAAVAATDTTVKNSAVTISPYKDEYEKLNPADEVGGVDAIK